MKKIIETGSQNHTQWQRTFKALPLLILAVGFFLTYFLQQSAFRVEYQARQYDFNIQTRETALRIERRLTAYKQVLRGAAGLFEASKHVDRLAFHEYVNRLRLTNTYPGIQSLGFSLHIPSQEKAGHIEAIRKEGFPGYTIFPDGKSDIHTPVVFIEPFSGRNVRAFGYDIFSDPVLRAVMEQARDFDQASISGKVSLVQDASQHLFMFLAVYSNDKPRITQAERRGNILGWIYAPFRMDDLMVETLGERIKNMNVEIFDGKDTTPTSMIYETGKQSPLLQTRFPSYQNTLPLVVFANPWTIRMHSLPAFETRLDTGRVAVIRITGTLLSLLLSLLIWQLINGRTRAMLLARNMTLELQESEYRWKFAIEGSGDGLWDWNLAGNTLFFSKRWKEMLGYAEDEIGNSLDEWEKRIHPDDKAINALARQAHFDGKNPSYSCEYRFCCKDGGWKWILVRGMVVNRTTEGKPVRMIGTHCDINSRKHVEEMLLKEGALQSAIFNSANFSSIATDAKGVIQIFNVGAERMLGYAAADVMNKITPADISEPQEVIIRAKALSDELGTPIKPGFEALVYKASRGIEDIYELTYIRKDGSRFPAIVSVTALRDGQDAIIGYLLIGTDNTARKQIETERNQILLDLEESENQAIIALAELRYQKYALDQHSIVATTDIRGTITYVNDKFCQISGYSREELLEQNHRLINSGMHPKEFFTLMFRTIASGKVWNGEICNHAKNGSRYWVLTTIVPFMNSEGKPTQYIAIRTDITERKIANDKLKQALNEKEVLLKEVYHRVKNNLQVVSSLLNLQARNVTDETTLELLKQSADRIKAMALLHEKLYQSKDLARIDFNEYIHSLVDHLLFSYGGQSGKAGINMRIDEVFFDVDTAIPCGLIINELLSNALQHAFPGDRYGEINITFTQDQGKFILVIADNGAGLPAGLDFQKSTSLGLQLVATLTNQLNGQMTLDQTSGSTFTLRFTNSY